VKERLDAIGAYVPTRGIPSPSLVKMSKLGIVLDDWMQRHGVDATAIRSGSERLGLYRQAYTEMPGSGEAIVAINGGEVTLHDPY